MVHDQIKDDYEVGYGRPPKTHQFKKGQSGNPRGRPKGTRNLKTDLMDELGEEITLTEGGKARRLSKQRALVKSLVTRAIKGDGRAVNALLNLMARILDLDEGKQDGEPLSADDEAILASLKEQLLREVQTQDACGSQAGADKTRKTRSKQKNDNKEMTDETKRH